MKRPFFAFAICFWIFSAFASTETAYRIEIESKETGKGSGRKITAKAHFPHPPEKVWELLKKYEDFPKYLPRVKDCESMGKAHGTDQIYFSFQMPFPLPNLWNIIALSTDEKKKEFTWKLLQGNMNQNDGTLEVIPEAAGSVVKMNLEWDIGMYMPKWVTHLGSKMFLPKMLKAFGDRLNEKKP